MRFGGGLSCESRRGFSLEKSPWRKGPVQELWERVAVSGRSRTVLPGLQRQCNGQVPQAALRPLCGTGEAQGGPPGAQWMAEEGTGPALGPCAQGPCHAVAVCPGMTGFPSLVSRRRQVSWAHLFGLPRSLLFLLGNGIH